MPFVVSILLLAVLGAFVGALVNWAIYQWAITMHRPISPWMKRRPDRVSPEDGEKLKQLAPRTLADRIPVFGWFRLRRDENIRNIWGKNCWVRPLLIEITWVIGLPLFYWWQLSGGLIGVDPATKLVAPDAAAYPSLATTWFCLHSVLIALMFIATFIDFDEQMIPDNVTVPGTLLALLSATVFTSSRLPEIVPTPAMLWKLLIIDFASPPTPNAGAWLLGSTGLLSCLLIFTIWVWGLLPKLIPSRDFRLGLFGSLKITFATILRPKRRSQCDIRTKPRRMFGLTKAYLVMWLLGVLLLIVAWLGLLGPVQKLSLISAFIGLAVSGGLIWGIRIVARMALGQEAMGFGDVTLMCMVGAFLGWQASIVGFIYSILFALVLAIVLFVMTKKSYLAFGPYLCMGTLLALLRWPSVWREFNAVFWLGPILLIPLAASLVAMAVLLPIVRWGKEKAFGVDME